MARLAEKPAWAGLWLFALSCSVLPGADGPLGPSNEPLRDRTLSVVNAGVSDSEDAPFVSRDYQFLPGDFVYLTFAISGFSVQTNEEQDTRLIDLAYNAVLDDGKNRALAEPAMGVIKTYLNREDKNWIPKRRASFLVPSYVSRGDYKVHIQVKDLLSGREAEGDVPLRIGGKAVALSDSITVEHFEFFRDENGGRPLELAAYQPGDSVYARFTMAGFSIGDHNQYHVAYGVKVLGPDGKLFVEDDSAAELKDSSFYPAQFLPGDIRIETKPSNLRGAYIVVLTVRDFLSNRSSEAKQVFTLE